MIAILLSILSLLPGALLAFNVGGVQSGLRDLVFAVLVQATLPMNASIEEVLVYLALSPYFFVTGLLIFLVMGRNAVYAVSFPIGYTIIQAVLLLQPAFQWEASTPKVVISQILSCMCLPPSFVLGLSSAQLCCSRRLPRLRLHDLFIGTAIAALLCSAAVYGSPILLSAVSLVSLCLTAYAVQFYAPVLQRKQTDKAIDVSSQTHVT